MIQYTAPQPAESVFLDGRLPRLRHFSYVNGEAGMIPRAMHAHEHAELVYICHGHGVHIIGDETYATKAGDLLFFDAGVPHDERAAEGRTLRYYSIGLYGLRLHGRRENAIIGNTHKPVLHAGETGARIETLCGLLHEEIRRNRELTGDICRFLTLALLLDVIACIRAGAEPYQQGRETIGVRIKRYLDVHYREPLTLAKISEALGVSPYHMVRLCKEKTGYSPMQYIINRRMGEAQSLLICTQDPVVRIAEAVGYDNPNYFSLLFKKAIGITASEYRRNVGQQEEQDLSN